MTVKGKVEIVKFDGRFAIKVGENRYLGAYWTGPALFDSVYCATEYARSLGYLVVGNND